MAFPLVAKGLLKLIPKLFTKTVGTGKDAVTKLAPVKTAATVGTAAFLYDTASDPDWSPFEGLKGKEFEDYTEVRQSEIDLIKHGKIIEKEIQDPQSMYGKIMI